MAAEFQVAKCWMTSSVRGQRRTEPPWSTVSSWAWPCQRCMPKHFRMNSITFRCRWWQTPLSNAFKTHPQLCLVTYSNVQGRRVILMFWLTTTTRTRRAMPEKVRRRHWRCHLWEMSLRIVPCCWSSCYAGMWLVYCSLLFIVIIVNGKPVNDWTLIQLASRSYLSQSCIYSRFQFLVLSCSLHNLWKAKHHLIRSSDWWSNSVILVQSVSSWVRLGTDPLCKSPLDTNVPEKALTARFFWDCFPFFRPRLHAPAFLFDDLLIAWCDSFNAWTSPVPCRMHFGTTQNYFL